jgi:hypothetical protein
LGHFGLFTVTLIVLVAPAFAFAAGAPVFGTFLCTGGVAAAEVRLASVVGALERVIIV